MGLSLARGAPRMPGEGRCRPGEDLPMGSLMSRYDRSDDWIEVAMYVLFVLYLVLFLAGFFLFGAAFTATAFQGLIFTAGILAVSLAVALLFHTTRRS
jgi:hypothetical protein